MKRKKLKMVIATSIPMTMATFGRGQMAFFKKHGFDVVFLASKGDGLDVVFRENIEYFEMDFERAMSPFTDIRVLCRLYKLFRKRKPEVIQVSTSKPCLLGSLAGRAAGVPLIVRHKWGYMWDCNFGYLTRLLTLAADRLSNMLAHRVVAVSHELRDAEIKAGAVKPDKIVVYGEGTSHGLNINRFKLTAELAEKGRNIRRKLNVPGDWSVIGTVMRINVEKGICELVEAFLEILKRRPSICLLIVGDYDVIVARNQPPDAIIRTIRENPRIHLVGWKENIEDYYAAMNVFVLPTYREGFCNANIEASAMELPVVSTKVVGVDGSSVLDGITGLLVPPRDSSALAEAIERILDNPRLAKEFAQNGRRRVEEEFPNELIWHYQLRDLCLLLKEKGIVPPVEPEKITGKTCPLCLNVLNNINENSLENSEKG